MSSDSRVGKFSGNFGYYGDNGQLIAADNVQIVNEGDKTYHNPATGTTSTVTDWTYDYSNRSYDLTLDTGDKINVTYGDENVTIKEGDTTYNIYYMVSPPAPTPTPTPPPTCQHSYTEEVTKAPTCIAVGTLKKTCTLCNEIKTETIPAAGHKWEVREQVNTEYDDTGQLIKEGYTIYKCSVCGQEYKDNQDTGPPDDGEGSGFLEWLLDMLQRTFGTFLGSLLRVFDEIPKMFGNFTEFLSATFSFFPPEVITILIFGIVSMVVVALVKLFIK